jgi:uncharacterized protein YecE (DUF72 family)
MMLPPAGARRSDMAKRAAAGDIRVGIGGWTFEPWRDNFYPKGLKHARELEYASRKVTAIEINGTYYGAQKPESFARWREETPDDFVFAVKGPRFATNRKDLSQSAASVERFLTGGVLELKEKLGPINWQFLPTKAFVPEDFAAFLKLLPAELDGVALRHAVEVRHPSFVTPDFVALARAHGVAIVVADSDEHPQIADVTAPFVYARLQRASEAEEHGYAAAELDAWADRARAWAGGGAPDDLPMTVTASGKGAKAGKAAKADPRDVFVFMINGHKPKAPAAAKALLQRLGRSPSDEGTDSR